MPSGHADPRGALKPSGARTLQDGPGASRALRGPPGRPQGLPRHAGSPEPLRGPLGGTGPLRVAPRPPGTHEPSEPRFSRARGSPSTVSRANSAGPAEGLLPPGPPEPSGSPGPSPARPALQGHESVRRAPLVHGPSRGSHPLQRLAAPPGVRRILRIRGSAEARSPTLHPSAPVGTRPTQGPDRHRYRNRHPVAPPRPPTVTTERTTHRRNRPGGTRVSFRFEAGTARRTAVSARQVDIGPAELSAKAHPRCH